VATAELLDACAGLPLAIRICAARLAARTGWTIRSMADRLRDTRRRLDELRVGDLAVRASFQVSFTSLPGSAEPDGTGPAGTRSDGTRPDGTGPAGVGPADAFRLLGLWPGPSISVTAAAALFGTPEYLAGDALEALVDAHLLESLSPDRYHFHDLLRVYASERAQADLSGPDRDAGLGRLLGWYVRAADGAAEAVSPHRYSMPLDPVGGDLAAPRFATADDALAWYDDERANVIAATRHAAAIGLHDVAWRLPVPLLNIFDRRGAWADCITTHRIALDSARRAGNRQGEAWVLNNLGEALCINQESEGIGYLEKAVAIRSEIGDRRGEAQAVGNLADAFERLGRTAEAIDLLQQARDLNRLVGNRYGEGVALVNLGAALLDQGHAEEAVVPLEQAYSTFTEIGYLDGVGYGMHYLGECHLSLGRDAEAMNCLREAVISHQSAGSRHKQALTLRSLGGVQARNGLADEARQSWAQAAAIFDELGDLAQAAQVRDEQVASGIS
jgi:tetratricopeptide (TPR) repeat protein